MRRITFISLIGPVYLRNAEPFLARVLRQSSSAVSSAVPSPPRRPEAYRKLFNWLSLRGKLCSHFSARYSYFLLKLLTCVAGEAAAVWPRGWFSRAEGSSGKVPFWLICPDRCVNPLPTRVFEGFERFRIRDWILSIDRTIDVDKMATFVLERLTLARDNTLRWKYSLVSDENSVIPFAIDTKKNLASIKR